MADQDNERRRAERVSVNAEFGGMDLTAFVSDLSENGVFVHTDAKMPIGALVELRFTVLLDDPVLVVTRGRVIRHADDPRGMGIEFVQLDQETLLVIADAVAARMAREAEAATTIGPAPGESASDAPFEVELVERKPDERHDEFEEGQTLVALRPVDLEIVDDESGDGEGGR